MEWQVEQVTPSSSKGRFFGMPCDRSPREQGDRVVAALAVARVLHALLVDERVDVLQIPGGAEAVGVNRLAPLMVGLLVAMAAVLGSGEALGADELAGTCGRVGGKEWRVFAEGVVVV